MRRDAQLAVVQLSQLETPVSYREDLVQSDATTANTKDFNQSSTTVQGVPQTHCTKLKSTQTNQLPVL